MTERSMPAAPASRRLLLQRLLAAAGWVAGTTPAPAQERADPPAPAPIRDKGYRLVQNWDFARTVTNDTQLREAFFTRYIYADGKLDTLNDEWQRYRDNANHVFEDGSLALVARAPAGLVSGKIESGMLRSKWSGQYGYFECRMKVPAGRGLWPAFWLNPQDKKWPPEIDIVEIVNNGRDTTRKSFHFVHGREADKGAVHSSRLDKAQAYSPGIDYADDFHTFAVEWTPNAVRHYVDDVLVIDRAYQWRHDDGSDGGPAHVLVNLAVGGKWPGPPLAAEQFPARLLLAHVRVWQQ